jgi:class 3 adenylate cyclase
MRCTQCRHENDPVLEQTMEAVHRYEGTVNQVMGDGIMALFDALLAHDGLMRPEMAQRTEDCDE